MLFFNEIWSKYPKLCISVIFLYLLRFYNMYIVILQRLTNIIQWIVCLVYDCVLQKVLVNIEFLAVSKLVDLKHFIVKTIRPYICNFYAIQHMCFEPYLSFLVHLQLYIVTLIAIVLLWFSFLLIPDLFNKLVIMWLLFYSLYFSLWSQWQI